MESIEVYIDNYDLIQIEVSKGFYNGESNRFFVSRKDNTLEELVITEKQYYDEKVVYKTKMFTGLQIGDFYEIVDNHGYRANMVYRNIVRTKRFNEEFYYDGDDLGVTYTKEKSVFKIWAPTAQQVLLQMFDTEKGNRMIYKMGKGRNGTFERTVQGDLEGKGYFFIVTRNGETKNTNDPYAKASGTNSRYSVVLNPEKVKVEKISVPPIHTPIIYEASVRDFTSSLSDCYRGTFKGFTTENLKTKEGNKAGFDYLKDLGVTHVQLLPIYDFFTVDEENKFLLYNWGYDPIQYNVPEGSYASNPLDPYSRIIDLKQMIQKLHKANIRVVMDVVYNHMYDRGKSAFDRVMPYYYFRMNEFSQYSNGSFCGNDFDSTMPMCRKYIVDSIKYWMDEYDIDGFRFDLMGILDVDTMNEIEKTIHERKPYALCYGEGWNMPTMLEDSKKAMLYNASSLPKIGFFNDSFRDIAKGKSNENEGYAKGYLTGDFNQVEKFKNVILGKHMDASFISPMQSINYVECHDNATAFDKIEMCCVEDTHAEHIERAKLLLSAIMMSQGVAFIHCGEEFCRTKNHFHNTYNAPDSVNKVDYERKDEYQDVVDYFKKLVEIRKTYPVFTYKTYEEMEEHVTLETVEYGILKYNIDDKDIHFEMYFNPTKNTLALEKGEIMLSSKELTTLAVTPLTFALLKK